ncbi:hypothetical protein [Bythopirellula goksoeyrii]|uniref:Uncharacterized protein n=1 Tax=Bythopirellula goksoeyrii TaxID=1400387 RepID=A0A5B9QMB8_9BACT|nr:hypothetical protein [Bythopirellula goksoeyrii]QEG35261.1 hypothetical protein Pr1d_25560 [Bythopirellula goksoeyrii]
MKIKFSGIVATQNQVHQRSPGLWVMSDLDGMKFTEHVELRTDHDLPESRVIGYMTDHWRERSVMMAEFIAFGADVQTCDLIRQIMSRRLCALSIGYFCSKRKTIKPNTKVWIGNRDYYSGESGMELHQKSLIHEVSLTKDPVDARCCIERFQKIG